MPDFTTPHRTRRRPPAPWEEQSRGRSGLLEPSGHRIRHAVDGVIHSRRLHPAGRAIYVTLVMLAVWLLMDAVNLQKAAQASPPGARRTASLDLVGPFALVSRYSGFALADRALDAALGRKPGLLPQAAGSTSKVLQPQVSFAPLHHGLVTFGLHGPWRGLVGQAIVDVANHTAGSTRLDEPTAADPLRVLIIGDSVGENMGTSLSDFLYATGVVSVDQDTHSATGLARPDYFDWPDEVAKDVSQFHPQVTVAMFGGNDGQGFEQDGQVYSFGSPGWVRVYTSRVDTILSELTSDGGIVLWVGMPPMQNPGLDSAMKLLDSIYRSQAASHPRVTYYPSAQVLSGPGGSFAAYLPDSSGQLQQVRQDDGVHLTITGSNLVAFAVQAELTKMLGIKW